MTWFTPDDLGKLLDDVNPILSKDYIQTDEGWFSHKYWIGVVAKYGWTKGRPGKPTRLAILWNMLQQWDDGPDYVVLLTIRTATKQEREFFKEYLDGL